MLPALLLSLLAGTTASPLPSRAPSLERSIAPRDLVAYTTDIQIHSSCNSTQTRMLQQGLKEAYEVASFARDYVRTNGANDTVFKTYFGTDSQAYPSVLGAWDALLSSNKQGVLLRCDDPDGNCVQPGWRGHWRGENGTSETVICDASYTDRVYNAAFCMGGFVLAETAPSLYWSVDLIHRLLHVPQVTYSAVNHYAANLGEVIELAEHNATLSPFDSDALQYFAAHVYALEVAGGGDRCIGAVGDHSHAAADASATTSAALACHTHSDGTKHCE